MQADFLPNDWYGYRGQVSKTLHDLFIADLLKPSESKDYLKAAEQATASGRYLDALIEIRKAIFVEFEEDYNVYGWRDYDGKSEGLLATATRGGWRAPNWKRRQDWIEKHVKIPTDYIQIDYQDLRLQAMEFGIHTVELQNLQRLTPAVFRANRKSEWSVTYEASFPACNATESNTRYCLDRAVSIVLKKYEHVGARREPAKDIPFDPPPVYIGRVVYEKPSLDSAKVHVVSHGFKYTIHRIVGGFDPKLSFYEVSAESEEQSTTTLLGGPLYYFRGFLQIQPEDG